MDTDRTSLDKAFSALDEFNSHKYSSLAPLYDILGLQRTDYGQQAEYVRKKFPNKEEYTIIEGGCESGNMLKELERMDNVQKVFGIEPSEPMASIASEKIDGTIVQGSIEDIRIYSEADVYVAFEDTFDRSDSNSIKKLAETAHSSLASNGVFVGQFSNKNMFSEGGFTEEEYTISEYNITIKSIKSKVTDNKSITLSHIRMVDTESGNENEGIMRQFNHYHNHNDLEDSLYAAGFSRVGITADPDFADEEHPVILAWN